MFQRFPGLDNWNKSKGSNEHNHITLLIKANNIRRQEKDNSKKHPGKKKPQRNIQEQASLCSYLSEDMIHHLWMKLLLFVLTYVCWNLVSGELRQKFPAESSHIAKIGYLTDYLKWKLSINKLVIRSTQEFWTSKKFIINHYSVS